MTPSIGFAKSSIPAPPPRAKSARKMKLALFALMKELTELTSLSYTPSSIAIVPPLTPGTSMVAPTTRPLSASMSLLSCI